MRSNQILPSSSARVEIFAMTGIEALFEYLIRNDRLGNSLTLSSGADLNHHPAGSSSDEASASLKTARRAIDRVRGSDSDDELWAKWRLFSRDRGEYVWVHGMHGRGDLDGRRAKIMYFDADTNCVGVELCATADRPGGKCDRGCPGFHHIAFYSSEETGEKVLAPARNLSWCPPVTVDVEPAAQVLRSVLDKECAENVCKFLICERCGLPCESESPCLVPHPPAKRLQLSDRSKSGPGKPGTGTVEKCDYFLCEACGGLQWTSGSASAISSSAECWEGKHSTLKFSELDSRRALFRNANVMISHFTQEDVDSLSDSVVSLCIARKTPRFSKLYFQPAMMLLSKINLDDVALPNLKELHLNGLLVEDIVINDELFPEIEKLTLENAQPHCSFDFNTSSLKSLHLPGWASEGGGQFESDFKWMIEGCKVLEEVHVPSLGENVETLHIASQSIRLIGIDAPECMHGEEVELCLWTPNLTSIKGRWSFIAETLCYSNHPLYKELAHDHVRPALFVNDQLASVRFPKNGRGWIAHPLIPGSMEREFSTEEWRRPHRSA